MKILFDRVRGMLEKHPHLRDNDNALLSNIWWNDSDSESKEEFLKELSTGNLVAPESITRARRKVQEQHPELRGKKYNERIKRQEEVKQQLRDYGTNEI